ncbi:MAG TPA: RNA polymerase sigma factor [Candidatus Paceibacterota bacterium]|nr:RNA polymerase sigma factor [Candidatus Paceibacterota bacterium]
MEIDKASDEQLVVRYRKGDEASLELLVKRYLPQIYGFARQYAGDSDKASDIAQETFVKVWKNLKKFDEQRSFRSWIFTIAKHTALDWLKRKEEIPFSRFESDTEENFLENIPDSVVPVQFAIEQKEHAKKISRMLDRLPVNYRTIVALRHDDDLTFQEIARRVKAPLNTVKSRYRRALLALRKHVPDGGFES